MKLRSQRPRIMQQQRHLRHCALELELELELEVDLPRKWLALWRR